MTSQKSFAPWRAGGASVIGASHIRRDAPNEDAVLWAPEQGAADRFLIAAADGHGGAAYFRSDIGAQMAVQAFATAIDWYLAEPDLEQPARQQELAEDIVQIWRGLIRKHMAENPLPSAALEFSAYGSTLVAVAASADQLLALQIGDGDLMLGYSDGTLNRPLSDDSGLVGEQTYSLCLDDAAQFFRMRLLHRSTQKGVDKGATAGWPDFALVATDGVSKSFVDDGAFENVVSGYRDLVRSESELQQTMAALPDWLREVSDNGSGDDASLCIATTMATTMAKKIEL